MRLLPNRFVAQDFALLLTLGLATPVAGDAAAGWVMIDALWLVPLRLLAIIAAMAAALFAALALMVFNNRTLASFTITPSGVVYQPGPAPRRGWRTRLAGRLGAWISPIQPPLRDGNVVAWRDIHQVGGRPESGAIALRDGWRTLLRLYGSPAILQDARTRIERHLASAGADTQRHPSELVARLIWVGIAIGAVVAARAWRYASPDVADPAIVIGMLVAVAGVRREPGTRLLAFIAGGFSAFLLLMMIGLRVDHNTSGLGIPLPDAERRDTVRFLISLGGLGTLALMGLARATLGSSTGSPGSERRVRLTASRRTAGAA